jgi:Glutamate/Leucine/Phenylalanine/Valine dehydrogenase
VLASDVVPGRAERLGAEVVPAEEVIGTGVRRVRAVRPRRYAECRDDPAAARLREAGILYAPDFVINAGGVLNSLGAEHLGWTREQIEERLAGIVATLGGDLRESGRRRNQHRGGRRGAGREPPEVGAVVDIARRSH